MIIEMRSYRLKPGSVPEVEKRFGEALRDRVKVSPLGAFFHTEVGPLNRIIHCWPYENLGERSLARRGPEAAALAAQQAGMPGGEGEQERHPGAVLAAALRSPVGQYLCDPHRYAAGSRR